MAFKQPIGRMKSYGMPLIQKKVVAAYRPMLIKPPMGPYYYQTDATLTMNPYTQSMLQRQLRGLHFDPRLASAAYTEVEDRQPTLSRILEAEIQEETAELNRNLTSEQFPGFSVELDEADVRLLKVIGNTTVVVKFSVSSSVTEWKSGAAGQQQEDDYTLKSMPEFQVQIDRRGKVLEVNCYFEEMEQDEETGETIASEPKFQTEQMMMYDSEAKDSEYTANTAFFRQDVYDGLMEYLAKHGINDEFAKNLVTFSTNYEKKLYLKFMRRLKDFVSS